MAPILWVDSKETNQKELVLRLGQINPNMLDLSKEVGCKAQVKEHTKMVMFTLEDSRKTRDPVSVN